MEVVRVSGLKVAYERIGEGPLIVLVHGAGVDGRMWRPQLAALADEFTVIAWDEPGAGRSDDLPAGFGLADYAHCLAAVIDAVVSAQRMSRVSLGRHGRAGTLPPPPRAGGGADPRGQLRRVEGVAPAEEVQARLRGVRKMLAAGQRYDPPGLFAGEPPAEFAHLLTEMTATARPASLEAQASLMAQTDQRDLLPRIAVPTLLVWGDSDARSPLSVARQFKDAIRTPSSRSSRAPVTSATSNSPVPSTTRSERSVAITRQATRQLTPVFSSALRAKAALITLDGVALRSRPFKSSAPDYAKLVTSKATTLMLAAAAAGPGRGGEDGLGLGSQEPARRRPCDDVALRCAGGRR